MESTRSVQDVIDLYFGTPTVDNFEEQWSAGELDGDQRYNVFGLWRYFLQLANRLVEVEVAGDQMPDAVMERLTALARWYVRQRPDEDTYYNDALLLLGRQRLAAMIANPQFVAHPGSVQIFEILANLQGAHPWDDNFYILHTDEVGRYLVPGFGEEHIQAFGLWIRSDTIWRGSHRTRATLLTSVIEALRYLAKRYPLQTLEPRLEFIRRSLRWGDLVLHQAYYAFDFNTAEEQEVLRQAAAAEPGTFFAARIERILSGDYNGPAYVRLR